MNQYGTYEEPMVEEVNYVQRFWSKVDKSGECWLWTEGQQHGYGTFWDGKYSVRAHRWAFEDLVRPLQDGEILDHGCRTPLCVRPHPKHVRLATPKQNMENLLTNGRPTATGVRGVTLDQRKGTYAARVGHHGKMLWLGYFNTVDDAAEAVRAKRLELFTHNSEDRNE
jgi:hypothetical protein